jgi:hypothetical protein
MMSNEHAGVVAVAMSLGIKDYDELRGSNPDRIT